MPASHTAEAASAQILDTETRPLKCLAAAQQARKELNLQRNTLFSQVKDQLLPTLSLQDALSALKCFVDMRLADEVAELVLTQYPISYRSVEFLVNTCLPRSTNPEQLTQSVVQAMSLEKDSVFEEIRLVSVAGTPEEIQELRFCLDGLDKNGQSQIVAEILRRMAPFWSSFFIKLEDYFSDCSYTHFHLITEMLEQADADFPSAEVASATRTLFGHVCSEVMDEILKDEPENSQQQRIALDRLLSNHFWSNEELLNMDNYLKYVARYFPDTFQSVLRDTPSLVQSNEADVYGSILLYAEVHGMSKTLILLQETKCDTPELRAVAKAKGLQKKELSVDELLAALPEKDSNTFHICLALLEQGEYSAAVTFLEHIWHTIKKDRLDHGFFMMVIRWIAQHEPAKTWAIAMAGLDLFDMRQHVLKDFLATMIKLGKADLVWPFLKTIDEKNPFFSLVINSTMISECAAVSPEYRSQILEWISQLHDGETKAFLHQQLVKLPEQHDALTELKSKMNDSKASIIDDLFSVLTAAETEGLISLIRKSFFWEHREVVRTVPLVRNAQQKYQSALFDLLTELDITQLSMVASLERYVHSSKATFVIDYAHPQRFTLKKTGSEARMWSNGIVENTILTSHFEVWQKVHDELGVPVAQILRYRMGEDGKTRVISRYCGLAVGFLDEVLPLNTLTSPLFKEIRAQIKHIEAMLMAADVDHGHTHPYNFTVEFVRKTVFQSIRNINTHSFKKEDITFSPEEYLADPDEWQVVVRLIDWDRAEEKAE